MKPIAAHDEYAGACGFPASATDERVQHFAERTGIVHRADSVGEPSGRGDRLRSDLLSAHRGGQFVADDAHLMRYLFLEAIAERIQRSLKLFVEGQG